MKVARDTVHQQEARQQAAYRWKQQLGTGKAVDIITMSVDSVSSAQVLPVVPHDASCLRDVYIITHVLIYVCVFFSAPKTSKVLILYLGSPYLGRAASP
jgi:hypothetical protein